VSPRPRDGGALSVEAVTVLGAAWVTGNELRLPPGQLARPLYEEVNEALTRLGGKWKGGRTKAHVFGEIDPAPLLDEIRATGAMPAKNPTAFFSTPPEIVARLIDAAFIRMCDRLGALLLEPSAGRGAIADAMRTAAPSAMIDAVELLPANAAVLRQKGHVVVEGDFLTFAPEYRYDACAMNPPFAVDGDPLAYINHVRHALALVHRGGSLAAIVPAGLSFRNDRRTREFRDQVLACGSIEALPDDAFVVSGTAVRTLLITMEVAA
jgi:predicted RNA methylase